VSIGRAFGMTEEEAERLRRRLREIADRMA
jgi:hypothetical protein